MRSPAPCGVGSRCDAERVRAVRLRPSCALVELLPGDLAESCTGPFTDLGTSTLSAAPTSPAPAPPPASACLLALPLPPRWRVGCPARAHAPRPDPADHLTDRAPPHPTGGPHAPTCLHTPVRLKFFGS